MSLHRPIGPALAAIATLTVGTQCDAQGLIGNSLQVTKGDCSIMRASARNAAEGIVLKLAVKQAHIPSFVARDHDDVPPNLLAIFKEDPTASVGGVFLVCAYPYVRWNEDTREEMLVVQIRSAAVAAVLH